MDSKHDGMKLSTSIWQGKWKLDFVHFSFGKISTEEAATILHDFFLESKFGSIGKELYLKGLNDLFQNETILLTKY